MKRWFRIFLISSFSLWTVNQWFPSGLVINGGLPTIAQAGLGLMIANLIVKPLVSIIMLPINLLTFGLFRWLINVAMLWLVIHFVQGISVNPFILPEFSYAGVIIPQINFNFITAWIFISFFLSLITSFLIWLSQK